MQFLVRERFGGEVITPNGFADTNTYYGAPPATGLWRLSTTKLQDFIAPALEHLSFGEPVQSFVFAFELADIAGWDDWFTKTENYIRFRRAQSQLISVGQLDWIKVRDLSAGEQFAFLLSAFDVAVTRVQQMARRPRGFDHDAFIQTVRHRMQECSVAALIE